MESSLVNQLFSAKHISTLSEDVVMKMMPFLNEDNINQVFKSAAARADIIRRLKSYLLPTCRSFSNGK